MWEAGNGTQEQEVGNEKFALNVMNDNEKGEILKFNVLSMKGINNIDSKQTNKMNIVKYKAVIKMMHTVSHRTTKKIIKRQVAKKPVEEIK